MPKTAQSVDVDQIERLADKVKALVGILERTRAELSQTAEDNQRLQQEIEAAREQLSSAEHTSEEVTTLLAERDQIRLHVQEMLEQLDAISL